jgi:DNA-directed RNA polymerase beta' subunit
MVDFDLAGAHALSGSEALALSSGVVVKPDSYNYRTMLPERRGLYCEDIFGEATLSVESAARQGIVRRALRLDADDRKDRWGHIELPETIPHPLQNDAVFAHVMVVPPLYRRFIQRTAAESRRRATERRKELLSMINDQSWVGDCKDGTDRPDKLLVEEGLETEADIRALGPTWEEPPLNGQYRAVVNDSVRLRRLLELGAPDELIEEQRRALVSRVSWLFEEIVAQRPVLGDEATLRALSMSRSG